MLKATLESLIVAEWLTMMYLQVYNEFQVKQLTRLIEVTRTELPKPDRQKVMNMITIDAHSRDVVENIITSGAARYFPQIYFGLKHLPGRHQCVGLANAWGPNHLSADKRFKRFSGATQHVTTFAMNMGLSTKMESAKCFA